MTETNAGDVTRVAAPLVEVTRGSLVESLHRGHLAAVDGAGRTVAELGAPDTITFLRSSAKPFQALPLVASGAAERFGFDERELALACGSHSGESEHEETARAMLDKIGLGADALRCGVHEPFSRPVAERLRTRGERPRVLQNNCSGKHAGMLALALHLGAPVETYDQPEHPVQRAIARTVALFANVTVDDLAVGTDGCGVPVFGMSVRAMALMYARLVAPPADFDAETRGAAARITASMTRHPEMVGGPNERFDTKLMRAAGGGVVSKIGADGVYTAGVRPCAEWPRGLGLAFKIEDGEDRRARPVAAVEALRQLRVLSAEAYERLSPYASFAVNNHHGEKVGVVKTAFKFSVVERDSEA